jgi:16S rRNA (cytosine1402-N4)-methyltransferase
METTLTYHIPVLLNEVLAGLQCEHGGLFVDGTVGCGGHTRAILEQHPANRVLGIDRDQAALAIAAEVLAPFGTRVVLVHQRYENLVQVVRQAYPEEFAANAEQGFLQGILLDLGISSLQIDTPERGFSFQTEGWLDMRMDRDGVGGTAGRTAYDVVNTYSAEQLADIFFQYGEERFARRIVRRIIETRRQQPIETTTQLAALVQQAVPKRYPPPSIHPATRVFQALRIEVNAELRELAKTLEHAVELLRVGGRICVISFHSLEDRIVKHTFARLAKGCICPPKFPQCVCGKQPSLTIISRKPIMAADEEQTQNPRARSAKLRIAEKQ